MANPYKKAEEMKKVPPGGKPRQEVEEKVEVVEEPTPPVANDNPLEGMIEPKQTGKACGFYLSVEAIEKLEKLAKQNKCSKSKALDALLRSL